MTEREGYQLPEPIKRDAEFKEELLRQARERNSGPDDPRDDVQVLREASEGNAWKAWFRWTEGQDDEVPWGRGRS